MVKLLLDTHSLLWFIGGSPRLSLGARELIADITNPVFVSMASLWEIAIKVSLGKLSLGRPFAELIPGQLQLNAIELQAITVGQVAAVTTLPFHHRDPFDRLLIARAMVERMSIVSADPVFDAHAITRLW